MLIAGCIYGVALEYTSMLLFQGYYYGNDFLVMILDVPIVIGLSWSIIIYTAMETTNMLMNHENKEPCTMFRKWKIIDLLLMCNLDALLALNIDLSVDAIAIRDGMWHWSETSLQGVTCSVYPCPIILGGFLLCFCIRFY